MNWGWLPASGTTAFALMFMRVAGFFVATPIWRAMQLPTLVRVVLLAGFAATLSAIASPPAVQMSSPMHLLAPAIREFSLGATLGLGVLAAFGAIEFAGRVLDVQLGFSLAQVFDPTTQSRAPVLASALSQAGVLVFLSLDGMHGLLRALAASSDRFPLGGDWFAGVDAAAVVTQIGALFILGFGLAAPVVFSVLLVELVLAVLSRNLPQMNMFVIALPVKVVAGLLALAVWMPLMGGNLQRIYGSIAIGWNRAVIAPIQGAR